MVDGEQGYPAGDDARLPDSIDLSNPAIARIYDYIIFGKHNYEVDRTFARQLIARFPEIAPMAHGNRAFLWRAVRYLAAEAGIRQYIDNGSGLPTQNNVHEVAQRVDPAARVVYVDNDPIVLAHGRALLADNRTTFVITADMGRPEEILGNPEVQRLIDLDQPVGLLYLAVLHGIPDDAGPYDAVGRFMDAVPSGSHLAISHLACNDERTIAEFGETMQIGSPWGRVRLPAEIARFFDGLEVVPPGLGDVTSWRLDLGPASMDPPGQVEGVEWPPDLLAAPGSKTALWMFGGIGRKP